MSERKPDHTLTTTGTNEQIDSLLAMRQHAIGTVITAERYLESLGYKVESAVITRRERRRAIRRNGK